MLYCCVVANSTHTSEEAWGCLVARGSLKTRSCAKIERSHQLAHPQYCTYTDAGQRQKNFSCRVLLWPLNESACDSHHNNVR